MTPRNSLGVPWFMFDLTNKQLITSRIIPTDISDTKSIILTEVPIPGLNYQPVVPGGGGNRRISFTLPLIKRGNLTGNVLLLKQFEVLRNQPSFSFGLVSRQFNATPKVLYWWGIGTTPLVWWVAKADASHKRGWVNATGNPQYSEIEIELVLDESHPIYKMEAMFRQVAIFGGMAQQAVDAGVGVFGGRPY